MLERKLHLVNWRTVCSNKKKGGLGIHSLSSLNSALPGDWNQQFAHEENSA